MDNKYLEGLGRVIVNFSSLEMYLSFLIWRLMETGLELGKIITCELSFQGKINLLASVYKLKFGIPKGSEVDLLIKRLVKAEEDRNKIMHSCWLIDEKNKKTTRYKITAKQKQGLKDNFEEFNTQHVNKIANFIGDLTKDLIIIAV